MNKLRRLPVLLMSLTLIGGCDSTSSKVAGDSAKPGAAKRLSIGILPIVEVGPIFVGIEQGYFAQEGLQLDLVRMTTGGDIIPNILNGSIAIGFSNVVSLLDRAARDSASTLQLFLGGSYETSDHRNHAIVVRSEANIRTGSALRRRTIAVNARNNVEDVMVDRYLGESGLRASDVTKRVMPFPAMVAALNRGDVDAASVVEPFIAEAIAAGHVVLADHYLSQPERDTVLVAAYATSRDWIVKNPEVAQRFQRAFERAIRDLTNPLLEPEMRRIVAQYTGLDQARRASIGLPLMRACIDSARLVALAEVVDRVRQQQSRGARDMLIPATKKLVGNSTSLCR